MCRWHLSGFRIVDSLSRYRAVDLPCFRPVALPHYRSEKRYWRCNICCVGSFELTLDCTGMRYVTLSTALCPQQLPAVASQVAISVTTV